MTRSTSPGDPISTPRPSPSIRAVTAGLALLAVTAAGCGEAEREAGEPSAEERPAATDSMPADTSPEDATMEAEDAGDEAPESETDTGETTAGDDAREAGEDTVPRTNPPEGSRNWLLAVFRDSVTRDDLDWLAERGFHVDTVMGATVRGWLEEGADRAALAEAEGGDRIESFEALMRGPGGG